MNQDPYLLYTGKLYGTGPSLIALSPDGRSVAVAQESAITICNSLTGDPKNENTIGKPIQLHTSSDLIYLSEMFYLKLTSFFLL